MSKMIKVEGCRDCPKCLSRPIQSNTTSTQWISYCSITKHGVTEFVEDKSIPDDCPLDDLSDAEARLKRCMEAREDELAYARREGYEKAQHDMVRIGLGEFEKLKSQITELVVMWKEYKTTLKKPKS